MSGHVIHHPAFSGRIPPRSVREEGWPRAWTRTVARAVRAIEGRRLLATLDDRMLSDIGLSRAEALHEASRAPWDLNRSGR